MAILYLIDGSAYIYRAYHAIAPLSNSTGLPTNAVYGFTTILRRLVKEREPAYVAVAFDTKGPVFRHLLYKDYKANRPPMPEDLVEQLAYIRRTVSAYGMLTLEQEDQEADDLIASVARRMAALGHEVVMISGDKDLLQLVSPQITMWDPMKNTLMGEAEVVGKYGVGSSGLLDFFALTGDSSDNIPGVPGIGPKTAEKFMVQYGNLEQLYEAAPTLKKSKVVESLLAHREQAFLSRDLVRLNSAAPVPELLENYRWSGPDPEALRALWTELEFYSLLKDLPEKRQQLDTSTFGLVRSETELQQLAQRLQRESLVVLDTETDGLDPLHANLVGISLASSEEAVWYLPCGHRDAEGKLVPNQLSITQVIEALRPVLNQPGCTKLGHNLKFDLAILAAPQNGGLQVAGPLYDTMVGAWLLNPERRSLKLDDLAGELGFTMTSFSSVTGDDKAADAFARVGLEAARNYSCEDVVAALKLYTYQQPQLAAMGLDKLMTEVECPFIPVLAAMERAGVAVDTQLLNELGQEFSARLQVIEERIYTEAGEAFNISSPKQLGEILFERLGLPKGRKTKTGWSTDVKVLESLAKDHTLPALVLEYRNLAKLKNTYVDKLIELQEPSTGRVHSSFNQCGTATGRLSSSNPNLQNIPIRTEEGRRIRAAFVAKPGSMLLSADYSQIDLRVLAHYSEDPELLAAFHAGADIHRRTAAEVFFVAPELVTGEMRRVAKTINFGIVYGMSSFGLANQLELSRREAQIFIDRYFAHFSGIKKFMENVVEQARQDGYVNTLNGRRRFLPDLGSKNRAQREFAERTAINTPIQGTAADIIKLAMLRLHQALVERRLATRMILQVHDELVFEVPTAELEEVATLVRSTMEAAMLLKVPLVVNLHQGKNLDKEETLA
ncbi:MAG: DNA polymerase I [Desulfobulbaceae bacterium]|nr:DNA polymerase I [Desulfobulbaceae bacterium]